MAENSPENKELIETVLKNDQENIPFEAIPDQNDSPLAQNVMDKDKTSPGPPVETEQRKTQNEGQNSPSGESKDQKSSNTPPPPFDAPEQEINAKSPGEGIDEPGQPAGEGFAVPLEHAQLMADTILGVANNLLEVGGGYFITIRKHKDFYDFDEVIQIIDDQNVKNIRRIKLDEEDKALLRPLLIQVLRKQSKVMSVEQQLLGVALSIIIKKARVVMEIRAENEILVDRIREVIRKEVSAGQARDPAAISNDNRQDEQEEEHEEEDPEEESETEITEVTEIRRTPQMNYTQNGIPASVLETNPSEHH